MNLTTQDSQVACFANAALHLAAGGYFVIETAVPQLRRLPPGQSHVPFGVTPEHLGIDEYETVEQRLVSHHVTSRNGQVSRQSTPFRYVWPSELDLMARLAGMTLQVAMVRLETIAVYRGQRVAYIGVAKGAKLSDFVVV